jgi:chorismate-pyruvate lyase
VVERYYGRPLPKDGPNPFRCQGFVRGGRIAGQGCASMPIEALPPFLRALLVTDGTVTKMLEAFFWEPVAVDTLRQDFVITTAEVPWIEVGPGARVLVRRARLRGEDSGLHYAHAFSVIRTERIPPGFRQRLIDREIGIGALIRDSGLESYREVMEVGVDGAGADTDPGTLPADGPGERTDTAPRALFRTYRIIIGRSPVILISETFPLELYA